MKKLLFLLFITLLSLKGYSQHDFYAGIQLDAGSMLSPNFENSVLKKKNISPQIGASLSGTYRYFDMFGVEIGISQQWNNTRYRDPSFENEHEGFDVNFNNKNYNWNYYAAISSMMRIGFTKTYLYGKIGYSINIYGKETLTETKDFIINSENTDKTISATTNYNQQNYSLIPEIGVQHKILNGDIISAGFKMNMGQSSVMEGEYIITDNITDDVIKENITSTGDFVSLNFRYDMLLHHISKKEKAQKKVKKIKETPIVSTTPKVTPTVADRKLVVTHKIKVFAPKVTVYLWDHQKVDGDRVSVNLNGNWVLEDLTLAKEKYSFEVELVEGKNIFVLHALNLGEFKPNTAAIMVMDGVKVHQIILESNMNESGTLEINYKPKK